MFATQNSTVTIETLPPFHAACLRVISPSPELDGRSRLDQWIASLGLAARGRRFGFDVEVSPADENAGLRGYEVWEIIPAGILPADGFRIQDFPGGLYATLALTRCFGEPFERIPGGWMDLHTWVIQSQGYQSAGHQWLEELLTTSYGETLKLYHPVMNIV